MSPEELEPTPAQLNQPLQQSYRLAGLYRVFFARLFDIVLSSIPGIILRALVAVNPGDWKLMMGVLLASLGFILLYFVAGPWFFKGSTLGKLIFGIRLKQKSHRRVEFWPLFWREAYFMLIPWLVTLVFQIIALVIMSPYANSHETGMAPAARTAILLTQLAYIFYLVWFIFVGLTIKVQAQHQILIDYKFNLFVVEKNPLSDKEGLKTKKPVFASNDHHVALNEQPGNFSTMQIQELKNEDLTTNETPIQLNPVDEVQEMLIEQEKQNSLQTPEKEETNE